MRDRVLYNLVVFALLLVAASFLVGQISIGIERQVIVSLGLTAISLFGVVIAIFIGVGLVAKEIDKRTLYTVLARPARRWQFVTGKFFGLCGTLGVNTACMAVGFFAALIIQAHRIERADGRLLVALWFIVLELVIVTALALLFSSFSTPIESTVFAFVLFVVGTFSQDLREFAQAAQGFTHVVATVAAYLVPNLASLNVVDRVAHGQPLPFSLVLYNTAYAVFYATAAVGGAVVIFERRDLK